VLGGFSVSAHAAESPLAVAPVSAGRGLLEWTLLVESEGTTLALADPQGVVRTHRFAPGEAPALSLFDTKGMLLPNGTYTWELRVMPRVGASLERIGERTQRPAHPRVQSGYFTIANGNLVAPDQTEPPERRQHSDASQGVGPTVAKDQIIPDDFIVDGRACIGLGCNNNEAFGPEVLRLKQSVVRVRFEDTSVTAGFPARDWQLTVNDSASGGADRFSLEDLTAGTTPLTIRGGAPNNSLFVDGVGNVGLGTATPAQDLHVTSGNTPTLRLEQTAGTVRTWDLGASGASFFVKDVTNASAVPFRVAAGAPTSSLEVAANGFVGLGTATPQAQVHVRGTDPGIFSTKILVENASATSGSRELFELRNKGGTAFIFQDTTVPERWSFASFANSFVINNQAVNGTEYIFGPTGNLTIAGILTQNSDRTTKADIEPVDSRAVLAKMAELRISTWRKIGDTSTHLGPMAQDFSAAFGLGEDDKHIAPGDLAGVSLAAVQGLHAQMEEQRQTIEKQQELIGQLQERLQRLETQGQPEPKSTVQP